VAGNGELIESVWLRFHPSRTSKLFPAKTVQGKGPLQRLLRARQVYQHKIRSGFSVDRLPVLPAKQEMLVDIETAAGPRRHFRIDLNKRSVEDSAELRDQSMPEVPERPMSKQEAVGAFDQAWEAFDKNYAMFVLKKEVDWDRLKKLYRPLAIHAQTNYEVAAVVDLLLSHLRDLHIWVKVDDTHLPGYSRVRLLNANWKHTQRLLGGEITEDPVGISWGEHKDRLGYLAVDNLSKQGLVEQFDQALEELGGTRGLILDLRFNGGGDEGFASQIAGRFVDQERIYSVNRYRNGPKRTQLGNKLQRKFSPRGPWQYEAPVVVLQGRRTMSSAESLALMFSVCPQVTTMGDPTAGSSANPRRLELPGGILANMPRWLDMTPDGKPFEDLGAQPKVRVEVENYEDFAATDPVVEKALEYLRKQKNKKAGRRP
jgi:hypothetical protein